MPAHKILKNCPPFFIFKNSERVLRIDIGRWKFQKFIITYLSLPRKNLKTQLQLLLPLNFAYAKKLLVKRAIFVLLFEGTNFIQKLIFISKNWPRLMKISEIHKDISELVWKKFGWWHLIPSWPEFCVLLFFTLVFGCFVILDLGIGAFTLNAFPPINFVLYSPNDCALYPPNDCVFGIPLELKLLN